MNLDKEAPKWEDLVRNPIKYGPFEFLQLLPVGKRILCVSLGLLAIVNCFLAIGFASGLSAAKAKDYAKTRAQEIMSSQTTGNTRPSDVSDRAWENLRAIEQKCGQIQSFQIARSYAPFFGNPVMVEYDASRGSTRTTGVLQFSSGRLSTASEWVVRK